MFLRPLPVQIYRQSAAPLLLCLLCHVRRSVGWSGCSYGQALTGHSLLYVGAGFDQKGGMCMAQGMVVGWGRAARCCRRWAVLNCKPRCFCLKMAGTAPVYSRLFHNVWCSYSIMAFPGCSIPGSSARLRLLICHTRRNLQFVLHPFRFQAYV